MSRPNSTRIVAVCAALVVVTLAVYSGVLSSSFLNYDDDTYVTANAKVLSGLNGKSVAWALTSTEAANWHPLTWLSHMIDVQMFGLDAGKHHRTSLLLHAGNAVLLFLLLFKMTGALWRSALVAALFAIHPLHVESVAWIAERKDVLSTLFWLLTIAAWLRYVEARSAARYVAVVALFALGLMSKPMLVTLPFTLLLLDVWPLRRAVSLRERLLEKLPLLAMSAASCVVTVVAQHRGGSFDTFSGLGFPTRLAHATVSYAVYLGKTFWPTSLAVFYPYPGSIGMWPVVGSAVLLCGLTALAVWLAKPAPFFLWGWLWYLGTLIPVIGLVQVGAQAHADRYTYIPLIGVFVALAWGLAALAERGRVVRYAVVALSAASLVALFPATRGQVGYWADSASLFERALAVTSDNDVAHLNLSLARYHEGNYTEAIVHAREVLRIRPDSAPAQNNLGAALHAIGKDAEAIEPLKQAIADGLDSAEVHVNLGNAYAGARRTAAALDEYEHALKLDPNFVPAHRNLGNLLRKIGRNDDAIAHFEQAVKLRPDDPTMHIGLASALLGAGRLDDAMSHLEEALRLKPDSPVALNEMGNLLAARDRNAEAISRYEQAVRLKPDFAEALNSLGMALGKTDRVPESIERFQQAVRINPNFAQAHNNLGISLARAHRYTEAIAEFEEALRIQPGFEEARTNLSGLQETLRRQP